MGSVLLSGYASVDRRPLAAAVAVSVLLHAALLVVAIWRYDSDHWTIGHLSEQALQVRLVAVSPAPLPAGKGADAKQAIVVAAPAVSGRATLVRREEAAAPHRARAAASAEVGPPSVGVPASATSRKSADKYTVEGYFPRDQLTVVAHPLADIVVPSSIDGVLITGPRESGVFTLFIDEDGTVRRMVIDGPTLPPLLETVAQQTFMAARFAPGELNGRPVKSLLRIEVEFDAATRLPAPVVSERVLSSP